MAVTHAVAYLRRHDEALKLRPISSNLIFRPVRAAASVVTADRRAGVGRPTIDHQPATDDRHPELVDEAAQVSDAPLATAALIREAIDTALDSLSALELQARAAARRYRQHRVDDAQTQLAALVESTQTLLKLAAMTAHASGTDIETLCEQYHITAERQTHAALSAMIGRQLERDWHGLARVIEQPFLTALGDWRAVFMALDGPHGPEGQAA
jgi:hypothetical protein